MSLEGMEMNYIDGFVLAVPVAKKDEYIKVATKGAGILRRHGALSVVEAWGDDVPEGTVTSFSIAVKHKEDESVVFSWVTWPSKAVRDVGMQKFMEDPEMDANPADMPFDMQRIIYGGFAPLRGA